MHFLKSLSAINSMLITPKFPEISRIEIRSNSSEGSAEIRNFLVQGEKSIKNIDDKAKLQRYKIGKYGKFIFTIGNRPTP